MIEALVEAKSSNSLLVQNAEHSGIGAGHREGLLG